MRRLVPLLIALAGCDLSREQPVDAGPGVDAVPAPNPDLVPPVGTATTLDVGCWNVQLFPKSERTVGLVADLIASLELDVIVFQEITSTEAWADLVARLPDYDGVVSSHRYSPTEYQKIGYLYRRGLVTVGPPELLFASDGYAFPRPPMKVRIDAGAAGLVFDAIGLHLKAGGGDDDAARRAEALRDLDAYLRAQVDGGGEDEVVVLGDYNENLTSAGGREVLAPLYAVPERYRFLTEEAALAGTPSYLPSSRMIDHITVTSGLYDEVGAARASAVRLDRSLANYVTDVSDHLPVVVSIPNR